MGAITTVPPLAATASQILSASSTARYVVHTGGAWSPCAGPRPATSRAHQVVAHLGAGVDHVPAEQRLVEVDAGRHVGTAQVDPVRRPLQPSVVTRAHPDLPSSGGPRRPPAGPSPWHRAPTDVAAGAGGSGQGAGADGGPPGG